MNRYVAALRQACMNTLDQSDETNVRGWDTVESAARTVFGYCAHRPAAIDGPHSGDRLHWCVCSSALIYSSALNSAHTRILLMRYMVGMTASESDRRMVNWMALFFLCVNDTPHLLARLLKAEMSDVDAVDNKQWTALMAAAQDGHEQCALALLKAGAAVDHAAGNVVTALMLSCAAGHEQCALALIKAGANIEAATPSGHNSLMYSCQNGHDSCTRVLIAAKADIEKRNDNVVTALMISAEGGHEQCALELIKAGAAVDATEQNGYTALMIACQDGHEQCLLTLIKAGAAVDKQGPQDATALIIACQNGHEQCALELIKAGAAVDATEEDGYTALMQACDGGHEQCALALIKANANLEAALPSGHTSLEISLCKGHDSAIRVLMSYMSPFPDRFNLSLLPDATRTWVEEARMWSSPLHFVDVNPPDRTLSLLRNGADIHHASRVGFPTPLHLALAKGGDSASLVLRASHPWSFGTHFLFPGCARRRAYDLFKIGRLLAASRFDGEEHAFLDAWDIVVMPHAIVRDEGEATSS